MDAIQGLGAFPLNVEQMQIDALSADGHKWLLGPEGCGILYVRKERQDEIEPAEFGWTNVAGYNDYASRDMGLRPDAGRYECGTLNTIGAFGLRAAIEFLLEVGVDRIAAHVQSLGDRIHDGVRRKGYEVLGERTHANGAGIVSFRKPGIDSRVSSARSRTPAFPPPRDRAGSERRLISISARRISSASWRLCRDAARAYWSARVRSRFCTRNIVTGRQASSSR